MTLAFACAKAAGYEGDDFLAAAVADKEARGGTVLVGSGDRDAFQLASADWAAASLAVGPIV